MRDLYISCCENIMIIFYVPNTTLKISPNYNKIAQIITKLCQTIKNEQNIQHKSHSNKTNKTPNY